MYVFGYGSLMWDGWESEFNCVGRTVATLEGFQREFNKASVKHWGSNDIPCPTLGLRPSDTGKCVGVVFEFPPTEREEVLATLRRREGRSFTISEVGVLLESGEAVPAIVPMNDRWANTYIGARSLEERARLAHTATGAKGACVAYVTGIRDKLRAMGIQDQAVEEFAALVVDRAPGRG